MRMRHTTAGARLVGVAALFAISAPAVAAAPVRNLVVFLGDDIGYLDWGAFGSINTQTPALNRLAESGAKLSAFHTQPLCSPSRASLLTGRIPLRSGVYTNESYPLDEIFRVFMPISEGCMRSGTGTTIPAWFRNATRGAGFSALLGKSHLGSNQAGGCLPTQQEGFDYYLGLLSSHEEGFPGPFPESIVFPPMSLRENLDIVEQPTNLYELTPRYTQRALQFLDYAVLGNTSLPDPPGLGPMKPAPRAGQPFVLFVHYEESHVPLFASPGYHNTSARGQYGDMTSQMDGSVAIILDALQRHGLMNETLIVASADNGAWIDPSDGLPGVAGVAADGGSNGAMRGGKGSTWQGGMTNPAIVAGPTILPGQLVSTPVTIMDIFPTFSEAAGLPLPEGLELDGRSFWAHVNGTYMEAPTTVEQVAAQARQRLGLAPEPGASGSVSAAAARVPQVHDAIYYWRSNHLYAIRSGDYKAHFFTRPGFGLTPPTPHDPPLLFDLSWDYGESTPLNVSVAPYKAVLADLEAKAGAARKDAERYPSQFEAISWDVVPCCKKPYNETEALMFLEKGMPGLALWDACVCNPENAFRPTA